MPTLCQCCAETVDEPRPARASRHTSTVTEALYPMYVLPVAQFLGEETEFRPHQELLAEGKLIEAKSKVKMANVLPPETQLRLAQEFALALHQNRTKGDRAKLRGALLNGHSRLDGSRCSEGSGAHGVCSMAWYAGAPTHRPSTHILTSPLLRLRVWSHSRTSQRT